MAVLCVVMMLMAGCTPAAGPRVVPKRGPAKVKALVSGPQDAWVSTIGRKGARQPFLLLVPPKPRAVVVLFPGGSGVIGLGTDGSLKDGDNFVVRTRNLFVQRGQAGALIAPPTDRKNLAEGFRTSEAHVRDIGSVIAFLRKHLGVPAWLAGTSRGPNSADSVTSQLADAAGPDGLVLTATVFSSGAESAYRADLPAVRVPTLLVHHRDDACRLTPHAGAQPFLNALVAAQPRQLSTIAGSGPPQGEPCKALHDHGFIGREEAAVDAIAGWIDARLATAR